VIPQTGVWVQDGKVFAVGRDLKLPGGVRIIDGNGDTLLSGLIDAHAHTYTRTGLKEELIFGVTTELGMQNDPVFVSSIKREQAARTSLDLADIFSAGWPATVPGGHGAEGGAAVPTLTRPDEAQQFQTF
jgi:predicted amidohydrolase YtcJ